MNETLSELAERLGPDNVLRDDRIPAAFRRDLLTSVRGLAVPAEGWTPAAVVSPGSTEEVAEVLRAVGSAGGRVVCRGGGTGIMGSAAPPDGWVVLDLSRLDAIDIDATSRRARVGAGARIAAVEAKADDKGLVLGHDPWTFEIATVGGAVATDGLGYLGARYGSLGDRVIGVTAVLADGTVVTKRPAVKASVGFDLSAWVIGTEGTLAVATELVLDLRERPEARRLRGYSFATLEAAFTATCRIAEVDPALLELSVSSPGAGSIWPFADELVDRPTLFVGVDGVIDVVKGQLEAIRQRAAEHGAEILPGAAVEAFWRDRHAVVERYRKDDDGMTEAERRAGDVAFDFVHAAIPRDAVVPFHGEARRILERRRVTMIELGVWVAPELVSIVFAKRADRAAIAAATDELIRLVHGLDGSMEYCHGVGRRLAHLLDDEHGDALAAYVRVKRALDPRGVLPSLGEWV